MSMERCGECGGKLVVSPEGFPVCSSCGLVAQELIFDHDMPPDRDVKGRLYLGGWEEGSVLVYPSLTSSQPRLCRRLVKLNIMAKYGRGRFADKEVFRELKVVCRALGLPRHVCEQAFITYRKMIKALSRVVGGRRVTHFKVAAAALALSSRVDGRPMPPLRIVKAFRVRGHLVTPSDLMRIVHLAKRAGEVPRYTARDMVRLCASALDKLSFEVDEGVIRDAESILHMVPRHYISGRDPHLLALAALYLALKRRGASVSYYRLAKATRRAASSIRANAMLLEELMYAGKMVIAPNSKKVS